jgi:hypothetical protein
MFPRNFFADCGVRSLHAPERGKSCATAHLRAEQPITGVIARHEPAIRGSGADPA